MTIKTQAFKTRQPLYRIPSAGEYLSVPPIPDKTIRGWIAKGKIGIVRIGGSIFIPQSELDRIVEEGMTPPRAEGFLKRGRKKGGDTIRSESRSGSPRNSPQ